jgi:hypothetical protein
MEAKNAELKSALQHLIGKECWSGGIVVGSRSRLDFGLKVPLACSECASLWGPNALRFGGRATIITCLLRGNS